MVLGTFIPVFVDVSRSVPGHHPAPELRLQLFSPQFLRFESKRNAILNIFFLIIFRDRHEMLNTRNSVFFYLSGLCTQLPRDVL